MRADIQHQGTLALARSRITDYFILAKPELTFLSVVTAVCGAYLASGASLPLQRIVHTFVGTLLVGSGAGILNQYIERDFDRLMRRTAQRPIPDGRVRPGEALVLGILASLAGLLDLALFTNGLATFLAAVTLATYLFLYTPLKRLTPLATLVGGFPGALPPVIGWVAVRGEISVEAIFLFALVFFWQIPHFLSLAWLYRLDYARGGFRILTAIDQEGKKTAGSICIYAFALLVTTIFPVIFGYLKAGWGFPLWILGAALLVLSLSLFRTPTNAAARRVFVWSLVYLPGALTVLVLATRP